MKHNLEDLTDRRLVFLHLNDLKSELVKRKVMIHESQVMQYHYTSYDVLMDKLIRSLDIEQLEESLFLIEVILFQHFITEEKLWYDLGKLPNEFE